MKGVKSWRKLCRILLQGHLSSLVSANERQFDSDEAGLKTLLESFLLGEGVYQPTWRSVIDALYWADEIAVARDILTYAEAVEGVCSLLPSVCVYCLLSFFPPIR